MDFRRSFLLLIVVTTQFLLVYLTKSKNHSDKKIILVDGRELTQYMIDFNIGCKIKSTYIIREFDPGYFEE